RIDGFLVGKPAQGRALPGPRHGAARRHVGRLIPAEHRAGRGEIGDLGKPVLELRKHVLIRRHRQWRPFCDIMLTAVLKHTGSRYPRETVTMFGFASLSAWNTGSVARHNGAWPENAAS